MKCDKKRNIILLIVLVIWIVFIVLVNIITNHGFNKSESKNNKDDLIETKMVTEKVIVQGDIVIYEIIDVDNINKKNSVVSVLNSNDVIIDEAYIRENRIIIDTSPLSEGEYKLKVVIDEEEMISDEKFSVIVVKS